MRALTDHEKRTIRIAAIGLSAYLVLFFGLRVWRSAEAGRKQYEQLVQQANRTRRDVLPYGNRALLLEKFQETYRMDPQRLSRTTLVAQASAAIQNAAKSGGIQLGPIRETPGRTSGQELTSMQLEGSGQARSIITLLGRLENLGFPLIIDSLQISPDTRKPGMVKMTLQIIVLDFEQWKKPVGGRNV
jgi:hypothetical protein